jgi:hypothetical protein
MMKIAWLTCVGQQNDGIDDAEDVSVGFPPISPKIGGVQPKHDSSQNTILLWGKPRFY